MTNPPDRCLPSDHSKARAYTQITIPYALVVLAFRVKRLHNDKAGENNSVSKLLALPFGLVFLYLTWGLKVDLLVRNPAEHIILHGMSVFLWVFLLITGLLLLMAPVSNLPGIRYFYNSLSFLFGLLALIIDYSNLLFVPLFTFLMITFLPVITIKTLETIDLIPLMAVKGMLYLSLVLATVVFVYWGNRLTLKFINLVISSKKQQHFLRNKLACALQPRVVRMYAYGIMALAYITANIESFSQVIIIPWDAWATYKDVLVEVLLTFVIIDSSIVSIMANEHLIIRLSTNFDGQKGHFPPGGSLEDGQYPRQ